MLPSEFIRCQGFAVAYYNFTLSVCRNEVEISPPGAQKPSGFFSVGVYIAPGRLCGRNFVLSPGLVA